jgi:hypothetical protein
MTMAALKQLRDELHDMIDGGTECTGHDTKITMLIDLAERASDELAEAYAALACAANIRAEDRTNPGVWEHAYAGVIARAKTDHAKVIV